MTDEDQRLTHIETDVAKLKITLARIDSSVSEIRDMFKTLYSVLTTSNGRAEEQSKRVDDLSHIVTAVIPQYIGAAR